MLDRMQRILSRRFPLSTDYGEAKLQLAVLYYWTKAFRTARAASRIAAFGDIAEALLLLRGLFNLAVDCLWMCADPLPRAALFYDSTAVAFENRWGMLGQLGRTVVPADAKEAFEHNRAHYDRVSEQFKDKRGKDRMEWAPGTIRDRAKNLSQTDADLSGLENLYVLLYKTLSDYEHSAPALCFTFIKKEGRFLTAAANPSILPPEQFATALGLLLGVLIDKTMQHIGVARSDFAAG